MKFLTENKKTLWVFGVMVSLDILLTIILIKYYGINSELNPVLKFLFRKLGFIAFIPMSIIQILILSFIFKWKLVNLLYKKIFFYTYLIILFINGLGVLRLTL